ncbi:hypothetical protein [Nitrosomonas sp.]|uniref:hypothetical protein n=1 Tax=Nitrosomonas sp. TaxID=42353 RepID=UPI0027312907|nr:hypothetical protein [Nitrosomonas sp.]MDP2225589.1 hypothetical protein [Nitrosomonas sp.]
MFESVIIRLLIGYIGFVGFIPSLWQMWQLRKSVQVSELTVCYIRDTTESMKPPQVCHGAGKIPRALILKYRSMTKLSWLTSTGHRWLMMRV